MLDFLQIDISDILDILLVAVIIYYVLRLLRGSQAMSIFLAILFLYAVRIICSSLNMRLTSGLLGALLDVGLIAVIVIFQPEIRRFLSTVGQTYQKAGFRSKLIARLFRGTEEQESAGSINEICRACEEMGAQKCGALIVIRKQNKLDYIVQTGDLIDARISKRLLENLFFKNSPLHDGAVILEGDRIVAARCTLPITEQDTPASFGMRHKAAIGISEVCDALVIVVSEETGQICVMKGGSTTHIENINDLKLQLSNG